MPVAIKIGQLTGTATTLSDPQKLGRAVQIIVGKYGGEAAATWTDQQKVDFVAERLALELRRVARNILKQDAEQAAAATAEQSEEV